MHESPSYMDSGEIMGWFALRSVQRSEEKRSVSLQAWIFSPKEAWRVELLLWLWNGEKDHVARLGDIRWQQVRNAGTDADRERGGWRQGR